MSLETNTKINEEENNAEIDLKKLIQFSILHKKIFFFIPLVFLMFALIYTHTVEHKYTISMDLTAVQGQGGADLGKLSGVADIAGIDLPFGKTESQFELFLKELNGFGASNSLSKDKELMSRVFHKKWDSEKKEWIKPSGIIQSVKNLIKKILGIPVLPWTEPSEGHMRKYLKEELIILHTNDNPVTRIQVQMQDKELGAYILRALHKDVDDSLKTRSFTRASAYIEHLRTQLITTRISDYRTSLISALSQQEKFKMMASSGLPYAAEILGEPNASLKPTNPNVILILLLSIIFWFVASCMSVYFLFVLKD